MIGIIGAMDVEVDEVKNLLEKRKNETVSSVEFAKGTINGHMCAVAKCDPGKVNAAVCAQSMILKYKPDMIINIGVAGSLSNELDIGEIAIGESSVQYDMDTSALGDPKGFISGIGLTYIKCDENIVKKLNTAAKEANLKHCTGKIATGDRFVGDDKTKKEIADEFSCIACEMEGGAIGHVCALNNIPYGILRAISDKADGSSKMDYPAFTKLAAKNSAKIILEFLNQI